VHLVESYRRKSDGRPTHRILANLGQLDDTTFENLRLALDASRKSKQVAILRTRPGREAAPKPQANLRYLDIAVARELWREWELDSMLQAVIPASDSKAPEARVIEALAIHRLVDPGSKLAAVRWFPHTALPELLGIAEGQFNNTRIHRVLDQLEAATPALMAKLPLLYRGRHGAFVALYMDVTDTSFVGHGPELAVRGKTKTGRIQRKIGIVLMCNEHGYPIRWEVIRGNCADGEAMLDMLDSVSGLDWIADAPVVMDRSLGRSAYIRAMAEKKLKFLTALVRPEFPTYAPKLPWRAVQDLVAEDADNSAEGKEAGRRVEAAGMEKVDDTLFVMDFGLVEPDAQEKIESLVEEIGSDDLSCSALRLSQKIRQAVADGRYNSNAAAARALGLTRALATKYRQLLNLSDELQCSILEGQAAGWPLATLIRIARISDPQQQLAEFEALRRSGGPPRLSHSPSSSPEPESTSQTETSPLRVRVVGYFNPQHFVEDRRKARDRLQRIEQFADDLNEKLSRPQTKLKPAKVLALVDHRLRRDDLLGTFEVAVETTDIDGRSRHQVSIELKPEEWERSRRYDGFSVLVGTSDLSRPAADLCRLYRSKDMVEKDFQVIKSVVELAPVFHRTDLKVKAHVTICMLALLLERTLRQKLLGNCTSGKAMEALKRCCLNRYRSDRGPGVYTVTETDREQSSLLRKLRLSYLADDDYIAGQITPR
jgi:hypothetical protein